MDSVTPHSPMAGIRRIAGWPAIAIGFSIPVSVALDNILLLLLLVGWVASGAYRDSWNLVRSNAFLLAAPALFAILALSALHGQHSAADALGYLGKYSDLLFVPVIAAFFRESAVRRHGLHALAASLVLVLALSCLIAAGLPVAKPLLGSPENPVVFKYSLTHSILMAFGAFLFVELGFAATSRRLRLLWFAAGLAAAFNVLALSQGRTGYLLLALLAVLSATHRLRWRGLAIAVVLSAAVAAALALVPGPFQQRLGLATGKDASTLASLYGQISNTERIDMARATVSIIRDHPLFGVGTGGFPAAYSERAKNTSVPASRNPHSEYLLVTAQTGIAGLLALLAMFVLQWRTSARLPPLEAQLTRGLVLMMATGCLFNSLLLDHTEGLLFVWLTGLLQGGYRPDSGPGGGSS